HEDHAGVAAAMTEDLMRTEMIMMKEMGVNFIRLGHYQQSRIILNLCDSLGILVWEEIPWCRGGLGGELYKAQATRMLSNMIEQHYNHPSIIIWGLGNENDWAGDFPVFDTLAIRSFMKELNDLSHKMDPSRKTAIRRCDFCKDIVDVYSPSIWAGWYRGIYTEYKSISENEMKKVDHFLHVEWGGDSHAGRHSESPDNGLQKIRAAGTADERAGDASLIGGAARASKDGDWSESYMVNLVDWHLKEQETMPWLTGTAQWPFKDFSTPLRPDNPVPYVNQKGVVERDFTKKETYYVYQSYWSDKPMLHIYGHTWPVRWGVEGETKMIKVFSNMESAEMWVDGKTLGVKKRNSQDFPAAGLRWEVPLTAGPHQVKVVGKKGKTMLEDSISFQYQSAPWGKPAQLQLKKTGEQEGISSLEVTLMDAAGITCLDSRAIVRFGITGAGELIDNQGTSTGSRVVQLYNGRAIIKVRNGSGKSVVSAGIKNIPLVFTEI
ncbi:MAG: glycoside hydrolase family 2 protein, partial [Chitinophagaceae bacterium]